MKKRVVVAMSGGVDSSVVAALLCEQGYECIGMHLRFWSDPEVEQGLNTLPQNKCCTLESLEDARRTATKLRMPFYVMNVVDRFKERVVDYFLESYAQGQTPNPCVQCNRTIKFGELLKRAAELNADYLATGHYAHVVHNENGESELFTAKDKAKDQSYFLYHLGQEKLSRVLFPLGQLLKSEVYEIAQKHDLHRERAKKESQGLCFFAESTPKYFLQRHLDKKLFSPGPIMTADGRTIGAHQGLPLYTIGQRQGLGIGGVAGEPEGQPWYVIRIDCEKNAVVVGRERDLLQEVVECTGVQFVSGRAPGQTFEAEIKIRYRANPVPAQISIDGDGTHASIRPAQPLRAISAGQAVVFYRSDKVLGGGTIEKTHYEKPAEKEVAQGASTGRLLSPAY